MIRLLVFGTGNIGAAYACVLGWGGADITCVCRSNYHEVKSQGIKIKSTILGDRSFRPSVVRTVEEALSLSERPFDYVMVCIKAIPVTTSTTINQIASAVTPGLAAIVLIQNGLCVESPYQEAFPQTTIISGVAYLPTTQVSRGVFSHSEMERLHLGLVTTKTSHAMRQLNTFASFINQGGATVVLEKDIQVERWRKIVANGAINPICTLSRCRDRQLLSTSPLGADLLKNAMLEIADVAKAAGYGEVVDAETVMAQYMRSLSRPHPGVQPSMMADMLQARPMEVEAVVGAIVKIGHEKHVHIPRLETLYVLLQGLDAALHAVANNQNQ